MVVESPMDRAATAINAMESENLKVTVTAVRSRAGVSMETARSAVEAWRTQRSHPVVAVTEAAQQAFIRLWAVAVAEADARHTAQLEAAQAALEAARAEAVEAGALVDAEAHRVQEEAGRADAAEARIAALEAEIRSLREAETSERASAQDAVKAAQAETGRAREEVAELRGRLAVLTEQATRYWDAALPANHPEQQDKPKPKQ
ncbi:DNA-binding protein [Paeniglutamicibacter sulfureus]|uniref:Chromosome segregation ATPase n=1 Tax=Paeniglutamicibacter sulfureus TaxID=43666 RepID=A0ABU2BNM4_9MICC|nr:DNA-binding protein [Paeniglutamicibacter sulfureus]MDR7358939.1 chromosome segregation ATPase [Paeniglutamicibacter sulfureus]